MARTAKIFQRPNWNQSWRWECCYTSTALSQTSCSGWPCRLCHWTLISHNTQPPPSVALLCLPKARSYLSSQESRLSTYSKYCNEILERNQEDKKSLLFFLKSRYCHHSVNQSSIMRWESLNSPGQHSKSPKHPSWSCLPLTEYTSVLQLLNSPTCFLNALHWHAELLFLESPTVLKHTAFPNFYCYLCRILKLGR